MTCETVVTFIIQYVASCFACFLQTGGKRFKCQQTILNCYVTLMIAEIEEVDCAHNINTFVRNIYVVRLGGTWYSF